MATKKTKQVKLVNNADTQPRKTWKEIREDLKITRQEVQQRVAVLHAELRAYCDQIEGAVFDWPCAKACTPRSLECSKQKHILQLVEGLNPLVAGLSDVIDEHTNPDLVLDLKMELAETGFKIGMLAGAILADGHTKTVAKFARGLVFDLSCHPGLIKD